jgi:hypothetical protein
MGVVAFTPAATAFTPGVVAFNPDFESCAIAVDAESRKKIQSENRLIIRDSFSSG